MPDADKEDAVVVAVTRDDKIYLGQNQISMADLGPKVADLLRNKTEKQIFNRADARSQYGTVMDANRRRAHRGVDSGLLTDRAEQPLRQLPLPPSRTVSWRTGA